MPCIVKKTLNAIVNVGCHYVVAIKRNNKTLFHYIENLTSMLTKNVGYYRKVEQNRGRRESRTIHVFEPSKEIKEYLSHIKSVLRVERTREIKGKTSTEIVYYVCDVRYKANQFYNGIRGHWSIENRLHWVKDVVMMEDSSALRNKKTASIISILKSFVIELANMNSNSVINFQRTSAQDIEQISYLLE